MERYTTIFAVAALMISSATAQQSFTDGTLIVLNKSAATATFISLDDGSTLTTLGTGVGPHEAAVSPDGKIAVSTNYGETLQSSLTIYDIENLRPVKTISITPYKKPHGILFLPDGERVITTVEASKALIIVNIMTGKVEKVMDTPGIECHMLDVTPDGKLGFGASIGSGKISVLDLVTGKEIKQIATGDGAEGVGVTPDGKEVWVTNRAEDTIAIIDVKTLEIVEKLECGKFPIRVKFLPDGSRALISNANSGDVAVFDVASRKEIMRISMEVKASEDQKGRLFNDFGQSPAPIGILITPDASHAFIANTRADIVTVIDLKEWKIKARLIPGKEPDGMAFSPIVIK